MKVLIADDHIPDESVHDDEIKKFVQQKHHSKDSELISNFTFMRKMIKRLRDSGFEVDTCNHGLLVKKLIQKNKYDAAVIDLGWFADTEIEVNDRPFYGWKIIDFINSESPMLPLIMYSNRLFENSDIPIGAAIRGVLPVYKYFEDTCIDNLIAVLHFVHSTTEQVRQIDTKTYKVLSKITMLMVVIALIFMFIGLGLLLSNKIEAAQLTAGLGLITTAMAGLFWKYLRASRKNVLL